MRTNNLNHPKLFNYENDIRNERRNGNSHGQMENDANFTERRNVGRTEDHLQSELEQPRRNASEREYTLQNYSTRPFDIFDEDVFESSKDDVEVNRRTPVSYTHLTLPTTSRV